MERDDRGGDFDTRAVGDQADVARGKPGGAGNDLGRYATPVRIGDGGPQGDPGGAAAQMVGAPPVR